MFPGGSVVSETGIDTDVLGVFTDMSVQAKSSEKSGKGDETAENSSEGEKSGGDDCSDEEWDSSESSLLEHMDEVLSSRSVKVRCGWCDLVGVGGWEGNVVVSEDSLGAELRSSDGNRDLHVSQYFD